MPRYYFDIENDGRLQIDEEGSEFDLIENVEDEALKAATEMARLKGVIVKPHKVVIAVRDERGGNILSVSLALELVKNQ
jgi:uncharacterized protein DUF6894